MQVLGSITGLTYTDLAGDREITLSSDVVQKLDGIVDRINRHEPVQYVLEEAFFFGRKFYVNNSVLIPRPETEELVQLILHERYANPAVLDIGTGSGCIPITLALEKAGAVVTATDVSDEALAVARINAARNRANVSFLKHDILRNAVELSNLNVVVSNPPYITMAEKASMASNVLDYEPHLALFVPDNDPLLFYRVIAEKAWHALVPGGKLYFEINERLGHEVLALLVGKGYGNTAVVKDVSAKERIAYGEKPTNM